MVFEEVAPGIFTAEHAVAEGKNAIILGERRALSVDAGTHADEGAAMARFVADRGYDVDRFALTHGHSDHVLGSSAFAACDVYAHALTPPAMERGIPGWAGRQDVSEHECRAALAWPTVTFTDELSVDLGEVTVRMLRTPGHSEDGVSMWIPSRRALVAGDAVPTCIVPAIGDGDSRVLQATLYRLMAMEIDVLISGHGPVLHGVTRTREWLGWLAAYLAGIRTAVTVLAHAGAAVEDIAEQIAFEDHARNHLPADMHGMPRRHRATVDAIVREVVRE